MRDRLRVLLISGEPHVGERTWRRLLKADPAVDLVHFTILRPPEKDDLTPLNELALIAFPTRELFQDKIGEFDLIILDRFQNRGILPPPYLENIADYVRDGGALLMSVGPEFTGPASLDDTPLHDVLPAHPVRGPDGEADTGGVVDGAFRPLVTALGAAPSGDRGPARLAAGRAARLGRLVPAHRGRWRRARRGAAVGRRRPGRRGRRCWCWTRSATAAWRCCCPTRSGCGRAAISAAARRPSCCAGSRIG